MPHSTFAATTKDDIVNLEAIIPIPSYISYNSLQYITGILEEGLEGTAINIQIIQQTSLHIKNIPSEERLLQIQHQATMIFNDHHITDFSPAIDCEFVDVPTKYVGLLLGPQGRNLLTHHQQQQQPSSTNTNPFILSIPTLYTTLPTISIMKELQRHIIKMPKIEELSVTEAEIGFKDSLTFLIRMVPQKLQLILYSLGISMQLRTSSFTIYGRKKEHLERCVGEIAFLAWEYKEIVIEDYNGILKKLAIEASISKKTSLTIVSSCTNCNSHSNSHGYSDGSSDVTEQQQKEHKATIRIGGTLTSILGVLNHISSSSAEIGFGSNSNNEDCIFDIAIMRRESEDSREFASGKKDGKILKITRETGTHITLSEAKVLNSLTTYYDIRSSLEHVLGIDASLAIGALEEAVLLLEGELPSEKAFHIPETYHKRLIGHGGKNIQRVMKQWAVYVKFLNNQQATERSVVPNSSGDLYISEDVIGGWKLPLPNVIIRTPTKNEVALGHSAQMIQGMIEEFDDYEPVGRIVKRTHRGGNVSAGSLGGAYETYICPDSGRILIEGDENCCSILGGGGADEFGSFANGESSDGSTSSCSATSDIFEFFDMAILSSPSSRSNSICGSPSIGGFGVGSGVSGHCNAMPAAASTGSLGGGGGGGSTRNIDDLLLGGDFDNIIIDVQSPPLSTFDKVVGGASGKKGMIGLGNALASPLLKDMSCLPAGNGYQSTSIGSIRSSPLQSCSWSGDSLAAIITTPSSKMAMDQLINIDWDDLSKEQETRRICASMMM